MCFERFSKKINKNARDNWGDGLDRPQRSLVADNDKDNKYRYKISNTILHTIKELNPSEFFPVGTDVFDKKCRNFDFSGVNWFADKSNPKDDNKDIYQ